MATRATGAVIERDLVRRWARRQRAAHLARQASGERGWTRIGYVSAMTALIAWLDTQPTRTAKKGGIGRQ